MAVVKAPHCKRRLTVPEVDGVHSSVLVPPAVKAEPETGWMKGLEVDAAAARAAKRPVARAKKRILRKIHDRKLKLLKDFKQEKKRVTSVDAGVCNKD